MPSSTAARRAALEIQRDQARTERRAMKAARPVLQKLTRCGLRCFRSGDLTELDGPIEDLNAIMADAMLAQHLEGRLRSSLVVGKKAAPIAANTAFTKQIDSLLSRLDLDEDALAELARRYTLQAVSVTGEIRSQLEVAVTEATASAVAGNVTTREGAQRVRDAFDAVGVTPENAYQAESLFRTNVNTANMAGRLNANSDPDLDEIIWGYEYVSVGDDRVRPAHAALDGIRLPKDDPRWAEIMPPNGYGCRCTVIEIFVDDDIASPIEPVPEVVVDGNTVRVGADEGFEFNPGDVYADAMGASGEF